MILRLIWSPIKFTNSVRMRYAHSSFRVGLMLWMLNETLKTWRGHLRSLCWCVRRSPLFRKCLRELRSTRRHRFSKRESPWCVLSSIEVLMSSSLASSKYLLDALRFFSTTLTWNSLLSVQEDIKKADNEDKEAWITVCIGKENTELLKKWAKTPKPLLYKNHFEVLVQFLLSCRL